MSDDLDWIKLRDGLREKVELALGENDALRQLMLTQLTKSELHPMLNLPAGERKLTVDSIRQFLPGKLEGLNEHEKPALAHMLALVDSFKEETKIVLAENTSLRSMLLENIEQHELLRLLPPPWGIGKLPERDPKLIIQETMEAHKVAEFDQDRLTRQMKSLLNGDKENALPPMKSLPGGSMEEEEIIAKEIEMTEKELAARMALESSMMDLNDMINVLEPEHQQSSWFGSLFGTSVEPVAQIPTRKRPDYPLPAPPRANMSISEQAANLEDQLRHLTATLEEVEAKNVSQEGVISSLREYVGVLEEKKSTLETKLDMTLKQYQEDRARLLNQLDEERDHFETEQKAIMAEVQEERKDRHAAHELEKKEMIELMDITKVKMEDELLARLDLERVRHEQTKTTIQEMEKDVESVLKSKDDKIRDLKMRAAMSEDAGELGDQIMAQKLTIKGLQESLDQEKEKREKIQIELGMLKMQSEKDKHNSSFAKYSSAVPTPVTETTNDAKEVSKDNGVM
mmetsp:Transcript_5145/g.6989  ORF Transcript_5145/g.6989 Transcript_5145/m.6989 type:complete len:513 (-) Transcript_5145:128-1666(-)